MQTNTLNHNLDLKPSRRGGVLQQQPAQVHPVDDQVEEVPNAD